MIGRLVDPRLVTWSWLGTGGEVIVLATGSGSNLQAILDAMRTLG